jgi:D-alanine-D-alanine ligase-like ATP-grasp enzyme
MFLRVLFLDNDRKDSAMDAIIQFPSNMLLKEGLEKIGYTHEFIVLDGRSFSKYTSPQGNIWMTSNALRVYPFLNNTAKRISSEKGLAYDLAKSLGATVPYTYIVRAEENITAIPGELRDKLPLIVKPGNASLSNGLTIDITNDKQLTAAIIMARKFDRTVLIQQQVTGEEVRFAVIDGNFRAAILRRTPRLVGDGRHTLKELLDRENKEREELSLPYAKYPILDQSIVDLTQLEMSKILDDGEIIELGKSSMIRRGASAYNITDTIHTSYVETAEKLASALGKGFMVVDMFIKDFSVPLTPDNYAFLEFNMSPNLPLFYCCRDYNHYDIIQELVPLINNAVDGGKVL